MWSKGNKCQTAPSPTHECAQLILQHVPPWQPRPQQCVLTVEHVLQAAGSNTGSSICKQQQAATGRRSSMAGLEGQACTPTLRLLTVADPFEPEMYKSTAACHHLSGRESSKFSQPSKGGCTTVAVYNSRVLPMPCQPTPPRCSPTWRHTCTPHSQQLPTAQLQQLLVRAAPQLGCRQEEKHLQQPQLQQRSSCCSDRPQQCQHPCCGLPTGTTAASRRCCCRCCTASAAGARPWAVGRARARGRGCTASD
jgi:hypothetical protein